MMVLRSISRVRTMSKDYEIKVDGEEHQYASGAIRYNKDKGDFNLIPSCIVQHMLDHIDGNGDLSYNMRDHVYWMLSHMFNHEYEDVIIHIVLEKYIGFDDPYEIEETEFTELDILAAFSEMLRDLAIHYQKGAKKYGVNNWMKGCEDGTGIPESSFYDSATRHMLQFICQEKDEPHHISAIWNCFCAMYIRYKMYEAES